MNYRKVTALINAERLEAVEEALQRCKVCGITVTQVKGYGEYKNFLAHDWMVRHVRAEIFLRTEEVHKVRDAIIDAAYTGNVGDGIIAVLPVEAVHYIRDRAPL